jgi:EpsD family peptidyl-prolyl cis-trans isomerase
MLSSWFLWARTVSGAVAVVALCAGCHRGSGAADASQVVAVVNREEISVHQINHVLQRAPGVTPESADAAGRAILDRLVEQELAVQGALQMKLERDTQVMQSLTAARREVLARAYAARIAEQVAKPDAATVAARYAARPELFAERRIYELQEFIVQADAAEVEALRQRLQSSASVGEVVSWLRSRKLPLRSQVTTQPAEALAPALLDRLLRVRDGQAIMLAAPGSASIVYRAASQAAPLSLAQASPFIEQALWGELRAAAVQQAVEGLRRTSEVRLLGRFAAAASAPVASPAPAVDAAPARGALRPQGEITPADPATLRRGMADLK